MDKKVALHFRDEFRKARDSALKDAEGYQQILFVLERMGSYLLKKNGDLGKYEYCISKLVEQNCPSFLKPSNDYHIKFDRLYEMVRNGRNDALHQGCRCPNDDFSFGAVKHDDRGYVNGRCNARKDK